MRLASPEKLLLLLGIQSGAGSLAAAGAALDATAPLVETALETSLPRSTRTDYFTLTKSSVVDPVLRLSCGFLSRDEKVVVRFQGTTLEADEYKVDYTLGFVTLFGTYSVGTQNVSVNYTSGFDAPSGDRTGLLTGLPAAVEQGALSMAASYFLNNPANSTKDKGKFMATSGVGRYAGAAKASLEPFTRPRALTVWSDHSDVEE